MRRFTNTETGATVVVDCDTDPIPPRTKVTITARGSSAPFVTKWASFVAMTNGRALEILKPAK